MPSPPRFTYSLYYMTWLIRENTWYVRDVEIDWPKPSLRYAKKQTESWCPYCWWERIWKFGANSARTPRYQCHECDKTFSFWGKKKRVYTNVFKKDVVFYYQIGSYWGVRSTSRACGVSINTLYRWLWQYGNDTLYRPHTKNKQHWYKFIPTGVMYTETLCT